MNCRNQETEPGPTSEELSEAVTEAMRKKQDADAEVERHVRIDQRFDWKSGRRRDDNLARVRRKNHAGWWS